MQADRALVATRDSVAVTANAEWLRVAHVPSGASSVEIVASPGVPRASGIHTTLRVWVNAFRILDGDMVALGMPGIWMVTKVVCLFGVPEDRRWG
jgi:hypothetical protein